MKRSMCGGFLLAMLAGMLACSGDPTGDLIGKNLTIDPDPKTVFLSPGETKPVTISVVDEQGNEQDLTGFNFQASSADITVTEDTTFLATNTGQRLGTSRRINITGVNPAAATVTLTSNGQTFDVPVIVGPVSAAVTLSASTVAVNQPITITFQGPYKFGEGAGATVAGSPGVTLGLSTDSTTMTFLPPPGAAGPLVLDSVAPTFAPTLRFSVPTGDSLTIGALTPLAGTASTGTAPAVPVPAAGTTTGFFDLPDFTATIDHFYRLDVTEAGDYTVTVDWSTGSDVDLLLCNDAACSAPDATAATGNQPESATYTLAAGTYYIWVEDFGGDAAGATLSFSISH
jgi:pre-peptidase